jgi:arsenite transporter
MRAVDLQRSQVWIYLVAILAGLGLGAMVTELGPLAEAILWPALGVLLYVTFTQVPLTHLPDAIRDVRFVAAVVTGNFVIVPAVVLGLVWLFAVDEPAVRLGVLLVLLAPCTDWFLTFTHLAGGDTRRAIAVTPVNLIVQLVALPIYLWLLAGELFAELLVIDRVIAAFLALIVLPLLAASLTQRSAEARPRLARTVERFGILPVPLLAIVVFLVAASQVQAVGEALPLLVQVIGVFVAYLVVAATIGAAMARLLTLPAGASRTLIFSLGTRNSFVVLPLALALAPQWQAAAIVIVLQSLVELFGMLGYLWVVPRWLAPPSRRDAPV